MTETKSPALYRCDNCDAEWPLAQLNAVCDLTQRVAAGEVMPHGQCPECQCLCHDDSAERLRLAAPAMLEALRECEARMRYLGHLVRRLDEEGDHSEQWTLDGNEHGPEYMTDYAWKQALAAIAQATGQ